MGRIKTSLIKRVTNKLVANHREDFKEDYEENKKLVEKYADIPSKKLRNIIQKVFDILKNFSKKFMQKIGNILEIILSRFQKKKESLNTSGKSDENHKDKDNVGDESENNSSSNQNK